MFQSSVARFVARVVAVVFLLALSFLRRDASAQPNIGLIKSADAPPELASPPAGAAFFKLDRELFNAWEPDHSRSFLLSNFQIKQGTYVTLELKSFPILTRDAKVVIGSMHGDIPSSVMKHEMLHGSIKGEPESHVFLATFGTYATGYIERIENGVKRRYLISPLSSDIYSPQTMIVYDHTDKQAPKWDCGTDDLAEIARTHPKRLPSGKGTRTLNNTPKYLTDALELTYNFYVSRGQSDVNKSYNYAMMVTAAESDIYQRDLNTTVLIPYIRVWNIADPYTGSTKQDQLEQFRTYWNTNQQSVARNAAHLYSASNFGGLAWLDVLCESLVDGYGYAWSGMIGGYVYPSDGFYWDPFVISHEFGHNVGSPHTQSCSWNPAIDSCVAAEQGSCYTNAQIHQTVSTIMSYCDVRTMSFHPKCITLLRTMIEQSCAGNSTLPIANAGPDVTLCVGEGVQIGQNATGGTSPLTYWWRPATALSDTAVARPITTTAVNRQYIVRVTDAYNFRTYDTVNVVANPSLTLGPSPDKALCFGSGVKIGQAATGNGSPFMYAWSPATGLNDPNDATPIATPNSTTTYIQTATNQSGCIKRDTILVTVSTPPTITLSTPPGLCPNSDVQIGNEATGGTAPYTYSWTPAVGLSATNVARPIAGPANTTKYYVTVTDALGCQKRDSVTVTVGTSFRISAGADVGACSGSKLTIGDSLGGGTPPYQIRWSTKEGLSDSTVLRPQLTVTKSMTYYVTATDAKGCSTKDTLIVMASDGPQLTGLENNATTCKGSAVTIGTNASKGQPPYAYLWSPSIGLSSSSIAMPRAQPSKTTTYTVTVTDLFGCKMSDTVLVAVSDGVKFSLGPDKQVCIGTPVTLAPTSSFPATATYVWKDLSTGKAVMFSKELTIAPVADARYELLVTDGTCSGRDTINVSVLPMPKATITGEFEMCPQGSTELKMPEGFASYRWSSGASTSTLVVKSAGDYWCVVTNAQGCWDTARVKVVEHPSPVAVITIDADTLIANPASTYQWYRNDEAIIGANSQRYVAKQPGSYQVEVTNELGCAGKSASVQKSFSGITGSDHDKLRVVPNPTLGLVKVKALFPEAITRVYVTTTTGSEIAIDGIRTIAASHEYELDLRGLAAGSYLLHVVTEKTEHVEKLVKL